MSFLLLPVSQPSERAIIEKFSIAVVSNCFNPTDPPSPNWLGKRHPSKQIDGSGLWNLDWVDLFCKVFPYNGVVVDPKCPVGLDSKQDYPFLDDFLKLVQKCVGSCKPMGVPANAP